jgi:hypothetical protein
LPSLGVKEIKYKTMYLYEQERMNEMWDDYFARADDNRERYASEVEDLRMYEESEREYYEDLQKEEDLKNNANNTK